MADEGVTPEKKAGPIRDMPGDLTGDRLIPSIDTAGIRTIFFTDF